MAAVVVVAAAAAAAAMAVVAVAEMVVVEAAAVEAEQQPTRVDWWVSEEFRKTGCFARRFYILPPQEEKDHKVEKVRPEVGLVESQSNLVWSVRFYF